MVFCPIVLGFIRLNLILLLAFFFQQIEKQKRIENDLLCRISQLEKKQLEDDVMLCGINRYWKVLDENCRIFSKQFDAKCSTNMFDKCM